MATRRGILSLIAALFAPAIPAKAEPQKDWRQYEWGREVVVCDGTCSFIALPLVDGPTHESLVESLNVVHIFYGPRELCEERCFELERFHKGRPVSLLAVTGKRERSYQNDFTCGRLVDEQCKRRSS